MHVQRKEARTANWLFVPLFSSDVLLKAPRLKAWGKTPARLSRPDSKTRPFPNRERKLSLFGGQWRLIRAPPVFCWFPSQTNENTKGDHLMLRYNRYYPNYEQIYSSVEVKPEVMRVLRSSDRKMRYMEQQLKASRFAVDQKSGIAQFFPGRESSL